MVVNGNSSNLDPRLLHEYLPIANDGYGKKTSTQSPHPEELSSFVQPSAGLQFGDNNSLMVINYDSIKAETIDRIDEVFTAEKSMEAVSLLTNTSFDSYWTKTKHSYAKSPFFTDLEEAVKQKESEWRRAKSKETAAKSNIDNAKDDHTSYLSIQYQLSIARADTNTLQSEKLTALASLELHRKKAFDLKKQRMKRDAEEKKRRKESDLAARKRKK
jgi:hypothetical protein